MDKRLSNIIRTYFYGLCMGTADALPGISGGTVALLLGIYSRLITAITSFTPTRLLIMLRGIHPASRQEARAAAYNLDLRFLLPLGAGMLTAVISVANLVAAIHTVYPIPLFAFFTGLIAASALVLYRTLNILSPIRLGVAGTGFLIAFVVSGGALTLGDPSIPMLFVVGVVAISAMILPGISGSLLLILLGQYVYLSNELTSLTVAAFQVLNGESPRLLLESGIPIAAFILGGLVGLLTVARAVRAALARYREATLIFLVSLIAGSVRAPLERIALHVESVTFELALSVSIWVIVGAAVLFGLDYLVGGFNPE